MSSAIATAKGPFTSPVAVLGFVRPDNSDLPIPEDENARYRAGRREVNLGAYLHYAFVESDGAPIPATVDEFRPIDFRTVLRGEQLEGQGFGLFSRKG
ncbi:MAG TPA: hypothetical protein VK181_17690 [Rhizobium sp.]|nr:hypothetical protein [Rhizobium sp.]